MKENFLELLRKRILVCDGAMGTMLYSKGIYINRCFDELNLTNKELVSEIHHEYIESGADIIETNTFGANYFKLKPYGLEDKLIQINQMAVEIARDAAKGRDILVAGAIGPLGVKIEPYGRVSLQEAEKAFLDQAKTLSDARVDLIILETFPSIHQLKEAITSVKTICSLPIVAQVTLDDDGNTLFGETPENVVKYISSLGVDVVGSNCSIGPKVMFESLQRMRAVSDKYLSAQPNAGSPKIVDDRFIYLTSPEYMEEYAKRFAEIGVNLIGGCCGTTPRHIKSIVKAIRSIQPRIEKFEERIEIMEVASEKLKSEPIKTREKSKFAKKLCDNEFVISVEMDPPRGTNIDKVLEASKILKSNGIDAVNIADGPRASARMSPLALAHLIQRDVGIEIILHYCCRDRNILGMQSDLLGASALGIRNLLIITGDPPKLGDYPDATAVFDVDSIGLTKIARNLNLGLDIVNNNIGDPTSFLLGVGVNPGATNIQEELARFTRKIKAGAEFTLTQPVFETNLLITFLDKIKHIRIPVIAGILPLVSYRNAEFLHNEVPGMSIPDEIRQRMKKQHTSKEAKDEGIKIAKEALLSIKDIVDGVYFMPPFGRYESVLEILNVL